MKRILILTTPRTGSNLLLDSLALHPQAITGGEYLSADRLTHNTDAAIENIKAGVDVNLVKVFWDQRHHPLFDHLVRTFEVRCELFRWDRLAQLASWQRACRTGVWTNEPELPPSPTVFPSDAPKQIADAHDPSQGNSFATLATIHVAYETLISNWDREIGRILDDAGWAPLRLRHAREKQAS